MDKNTIKKWGARGLPVLAALLTGGTSAGLMAAVGVVRDALGDGEVQTPEQARSRVETAIARGDEETLSRLRIAEQEKTAFLMAQLAAERESVAGVQALAAKEVESEDRLIRWARPSIIWSFCATTTATIAGVLWCVFIGDRETLDALGGVLPLATPIWAAQAGAAGFYIHKRSQDKELRPLA